MCAQLGVVEAAVHVVAACATRGEAPQPPLPSPCGLRFLPHPLPRAATNFADVISNDVQQTFVAQVSALVARVRAARWACALRAALPRTHALPPGPVPCTRSSTTSRSIGLRAGSPRGMAPPHSSSLITAMTRWGGHLTCRVSESD